MLKAKSLRSETEESLHQMIASLKEEILKIVNQTDRSATKPHLLGQKRKEIARILTVLREKEIERVG